jgi:molybdenum cofactor synthesis domain-containing protein
VRALVVTVLDRVSRGEADDRSGPSAAAVLRGLGFDPEITVVPDGIDSVAAPLRSAVADGIPLVITTGGTGMSPRDLTPEATRTVIEREAPGLVEAMRAVTFATNPRGMLSRAVSGVAGSTLIVNLPGSVAGVEESLAVIGPALRHAVELVAGTGDGH